MKRYLLNSLWTGKSLGVYVVGFHRPLDALHFFRAQGYGHIFVTEYHPVWE